MLKRFMIIIGFLYSAAAMAEDISTEEIDDQKAAQKQCVKMRLNECIVKCKDSLDESCAQLCKEDIENECKYAGE